MTSRALPDVMTFTGLIGVVPKSVPRAVVMDMKVVDGRGGWARPAFALMAVRSAGDKEIENVK